jgi:hypothetical protein
MKSYAKKTEKQMEFEDTVVNKVKPLLSSHEQIDFSYGTLFVKCAEETARCIFNTLCDNFGGVNKVRISKCGEEFAFDFVA